VVEVLIEEMFGSDRSRFERLQTSRGRRAGKKESEKKRKRKTLSGEKEEVCSKRA
jgi:hypothetical protein